MLGWLFGKRKEKSTLSKEEFTQRQYETELKVMENEENPPPATVHNPTTTNPYLTVEEEKKDVRRRLSLARQRAEQGVEISLNTIFKHLDEGHAVFTDTTLWSPYLIFKEEDEYCIHSMIDDLTIKGKEHIVTMVKEFYDDKIPYYALPMEFQRGDYHQNFYTRIHKPTDKTLMYYLKLRPSISVMLGGVRLSIKDNKYYISEKLGSVYMKKEVKIVEFTQYLDLYTNGYEKPKYFYNGKQIKL